MSDQALRNKGLKVTTPRLKILQLFEAKQTHLSADEVHSMIKEGGEPVGLATVYRVLTQFEQAGILVRHHFEDDRAVFELVQDNHHDHIVCARCSKVEEFFDETIEVRQAEIAQQHGFTLTDHAMTLYGVCSACQKEAA